MITLLNRTARHATIFVLILATVSVALDAAPAQADGPIIHVVNYGETLYSLGRQYKASLESLISLNRLSKDGTIIAGQRLLIPTNDAPVQPALELLPTAWRVANVPRLRQQQALTCEEAAAAMAARGQVSEWQIVRAMPRSADPFEGIRGRTNAPIWGSLADYGTYAQGLQRGLRRLGLASTVLYGQSYTAFKASILASLRSGRPVVWWTTFREQVQTPVYVTLPDGRAVKLVRFEHTVTIVGATANGFIYYDPEDGSARTVSFATHQRTSAYFDNMALAVD